MSDFSDAYKIGLPMDKIKIGMRLRPVDDYQFMLEGHATVTEITERGFRYDTERGYCLHPLIGTVLPRGHEHYGLGNGRSTFLEAASQITATRVAPARSDDANDSLSETPEPHAHDASAEGRS